MNSEPTLTDIIEQLRNVVTEDGVAIWLDSAITNLGGERPINLCKSPSGRRRVYEYAATYSEPSFT